MKARIISIEMYLSALSLFYKGYEMQEALKSDEVIRSREHVAFI
jgi:hypothetical protein